MSVIADPVNKAARVMPAWPIYVGALGYAGWMLYLGITNQLGVDPVKVLEHKLGEAGLYMLVAGLAITPLRKYAGINLLKYRRAIGVSCFLLVFFHLTVWAVLDVQQLGRVWADIVKRPYITVGMGAFVLMLPLALTSNNWSVRRLGAKWRKLHKLVYPAAILGAVHYVMLVKGIQFRPMVFLGIVLILVGLRYWPKKRA